MQNFFTFLLFIDYQLFTIHPSRVGAFTSKKQPILAFSNIFFTKIWKVKKRAYTITERSTEKQRCKCSEKNCFKI